VRPLRFDRRAPRASASVLDGDVDGGGDDGDDGDVKTATRLRRNPCAKWDRARRRRLLKMLGRLSGDARWVQVLILTWDGVS